MTDFESLWKNACTDQVPDPKGAVGTLIQAFAKHLDVEEVEWDQVGPAALFLLDLSTLGFKGMDLNVVMVTHPPADEDAMRVQQALLAQYKQAVQSVGFCFQLLLARTRPASPLLAPDHLNSVLMTGDDVERVLVSRAPKSVLFGIIKRQVHLQWLCPFNVTEEARGAMFVGRSSEIGRVTLELDRHFLITGARRVGKTSLMRKAYDLLRMRPTFRDQRVHFFHCLSWGDYWDCVKRLAHTVAPRKELRLEKGRHNVSYMLREASAGGSKPLLLFFDEMDAVVEADFATGDWPFFKLLREAAAQGYIRVCFAGYRSMSRLLHDGSARQGSKRDESSSPFYGAIELLRLTQLSRPETELLITSPLRAQEIDIVNEVGLNEQIWLATKGFPFMVQFYGERLYALAMQRTPPVVFSDDVSVINKSRDLNRFLELHFHDNTRQGDEAVKSERLCTFLHAVRSNGALWTRGDFLKQCQDAGLFLSADSLSQALENLVDANIFESVERRYRITFEALALLLRESYEDVASYIRSLEGN